MGSSCRNSIYDKIRQKWVAATPEEVVRQRLILKMTQELGFPKTHLAIEKELKELPHIESSSTLPNRRADLICFARGIHRDFALYPLLLIECKAEPLNEDAVQQVIGYNAFVRAPFIALVNAAEMRCGHYSANEGKYNFVPYLPSYQELLKGIS